MMAAVAVAAVLATGPSAAQDTRTAARAAMQKWQDAVVNVRIALKVRMSMAGREVQSMDDSVDAVGTVIEADGLTVMSLRSLNPGSMMSKIMGSVSGGGQPAMEITSEPSDVKIRLADGRELTSKIALRDEDLDLAFLRPVTAPDRPLVAVNLADAAAPAVLDEVLVLSRLGRVGGWTASASLYDIGAIIEKPRTFFVIGGATPQATGVPAFQADGKIVGVLTIRQVEPGRSGMFAMMGGTEGLGLLPVILPAADVLEIAKQAPK
jgi:S1-C subfamily serine protease